MKVCSDGPGHMTSMAAMPIYGKNFKNLLLRKQNTDDLGGARWLSGRVSDSGARGPGFETYRRRVVS